MPRWSKKKSYKLTKNIKRALLLNPKNNKRLIITAIILSAVFFYYPIFATERVDINTASLDQLDQLEGIGSVYAQRIIDGRPYSSLDDLLSVKGIGPTILQKIKDQGLACVDCDTTQESSNGEALEPSDSPAPTSAAGASPTPSAINYHYSQKVFLNEFLAWPEESAKEWVELINLENASVNLSGWQIDDDDNSTAPQIIPADTIISANGFLIITFNKSTLNNDGDKVRLLWPDDQVVHSVSFAKATQGQAVAKFGSGWLWTNQPTPGQVNKKSLIPKEEGVAVRSSGAGKITPTEESVAVATSAPISKRAILQTIAPTPPENTPMATQEASKPNLLAAAEESTAGSAVGEALPLIGIIFLAVLSAVGLIYFRRQKQVDTGSPDD